MFLSLLTQRNQTKLNGANEHLLEPEMMVDGATLSSTQMLCTEFNDKNYLD